MKIVILIVKLVLTSLTSFNIYYVNLYIFVCNTVYFETWVQVFKLLVQNSLHQKNIPLSTILYVAI